MAAAVLLALGLVLLDVQGASAAAGTIVTTVDDIGSYVHMACIMNHSDIAVTGHQWLRGSKVLKEDKLPDLRTEYQVDKAGSAGEYACVFLPDPLTRAKIPVSGPPVIKAIRKSEQATEGQTVTLACKSYSYPPIDTWVWSRLFDSRDQDITNGSQSKFFVNSSKARSELLIENLNITLDHGTYACSGTNSEGTSRATIILHVHHHLEALWPFLGIIVVMLMLINIIFICEKWQLNEPVEDDYARSAPLKGSMARVNVTGKNVHQRSAT
ncbi:PREDICTED: basigin-like [Chinchilla lanigera]|uniref:basigin-like n=1 Tax=Chinchilla lanigera TaxID=34839 RepID=UPI000696B8D1|nr:PREDICTED: basigin-like [Chinchilla lanigera]